MDKENDLSEPSSSQQESPYREVDEYLPQSHDSFYIAQSSQPQYLINSNNSEIEQNEVSSFAPERSNDLFAVDNSYSQSDKNHHPFPSTHEEDQSEETNGFSSFRISPRFSLGHSRFSYYAESNSGGSAQERKSQKAHKNVGTPPCEFRESMPSTSKESYCKESREFRKKVFNRDFEGQNKSQNSIYPDSNQRETLKVGSTEDKVYIPPFKKRITSNPNSSYFYSSSESDDETGLDLSNSFGSSRPITSLVKKKVYKGIHSDYNQASTSNQAACSKDILNFDLHHSSTPVESCLVSSSTGHMDSQPSSPSSLHVNLVPSLNEDSESSPLLDSTVDSTSGQNISSPFSNQSDADEIRSSGNKIFQMDLEDSRDVISTSMSHLPQVVSGENSNMELLAVTSKTFSNTRNEGSFISLENFSAHQINPGLPEQESNNGHDVPSILSSPSSSYFDSEHLAVPGPSGINRITETLASNSESNSNVTFGATDSLDLTVNSGSCISQCTKHQGTQGSLNQEAISIEMNDMEPESSNFAGSPRIESYYSVRDCSSMNHLERDYSSRTLNQLNQSYLFEIGENSLDHEEIHSDYTAIVKKEEMFEESSEIGEPLEMEEAASEVSRNIHGGPYDLALDSHLKKYLPGREISHNFVGPLNGIEGSQQIQTNELPLGSSSPLKLPGIANQASSYVDVSLSKHTFCDGDAISCLNTPFDNNEECAIDFRTKASGSISSLNSESLSKFPKSDAGQDHSLFKTSFHDPRTSGKHSPHMLEDASVPTFQCVEEKLTVKDELSNYSQDAATTLSGESLGNPDSSVAISLKDNDNNFAPSFWCDECGVTLQEKCGLHKIQTISDKPILKRAWASLPAFHLSIKEILPDDHFGVFARRNIPKRTQFGPLQGKYVEKEQPSLSLNFPVRYEQKLVFIDTSEPESSNWMSLVRDAKNYLEMNCVVIEQEENIYFLTITDIRPKTELKLGYSKQYAIKYGLTYLTPSKEEQKILDDLEKKFPCYECDESFKTPVDLEAHLNRYHENVSDKRLRRRGKKRLTQNDKVTLNSSSEMNSNKERKVRNSAACEECCLSFESKELVEIHSHCHAPSKDFSPSDGPSDPCPSCSAQFQKMEELIDHVKQHSSPLSKHNSRTFKCLLCYKAFNDKKKLDKHVEIHENDSEKAFACYICSRRFASKSALESHIKFHSGMKVTQYDCPMCNERFFSVINLKKHFPTHAVRGQYTCSTCDKKFPSYVQIRRHIRGYHSAVHSCSECGKTFPSLDKIKLHKLTHSDQRDFVCPHCSRGFKRKDKMKEHIKKLHSAEREAKRKSQPNPISKHNDYEQCVYKCHECMLGFKRRGMLVNHLSSRHPTIELSSVPELNQPIIRACRSYCCQYCKKSYVSSTKRKMHIIKCHPGAEVPPSRALVKVDDPKAINARMTRVIPASCQWCPRQYATNAKLLQHQRKSHSQLLSKGISSRAKKQKFSAEESLKDVSFPSEAQSTQGIDLSTSDESNPQKASFKQPSSQDEPSVDSNERDILCQAIGRITNNEPQQYFRVGLVSHPPQQLIQIKMHQPSLNEAENLPVDQPAHHLLNDQQLIMGIPSTSNQGFVLSNVEQDGVPALALLATDGSDTYTLSLRSGHLLQNLNSLSVVSPTDAQSNELAKEDHPHSSKAYSEGAQQVILADNPLEENSRGNEGAIVDQLSPQIVVWHPNSVSFASSGM